MMNVCNISNVIGTLASYLNFTLIYRSVTNKKAKLTIFYFLLILILSILNVFLIIKLSVIIKLIYNILCLIISMKYASKDTFKSILYYVFVFWLFGAFMDIAFTSVMLPLFRHIIKIWPNFGMLILSLCIQVLLYLVIQIKGLKRFILNVKRKLDTIKNIVWMYIIMMFLVILFGVFAFINMESLNISLLFLVLLVISIVMSIFFIKNIYLEKVYLCTINNLLDNNKYYCDINKENKIFKHNIMHELNSIKSVADKKTTKLIQNLIDDNNLLNANCNEDGNLPNGINGLISRYIYSDTSKLLNIIVNNYLKSDLLKSLSPREYNGLCETLGICLDNAVVASKKSKDKILHVTLLEDNESIIIKIINTFEDSLEVDKLGNADYTTKKDGHGLGLYSVFRRKNIRLKSTIINDLFENQIIVGKIKTPN